MSQEDELANEFNFEDLPPMEQQQPSPSPLSKPKLGTGQTGMIADFRHSTVAEDLPVFQQSHKSKT
jgi:hypothetical protein